MEILFIFKFFLIKFRSMRAPSSPIPCSLSFWTRCDSLSSFRCPRRLGFDAVLPRFDALDRDQAAKKIRLLFPLFLFFFAASELAPIPLLLLARIELPARSPPLNQRRRRRAVRRDDPADLTWCIGAVVEQFSTLQTTGSARRCPGAEVATVGQIAASRIDATMAGGCLQRS
jgi:hypothetical protein